VPAARRGTGLHIAERVNPGRGSLQAVVHLDVAALIDAPQAARFSASVCGIRPVASSRWEPVTIIVPPGPLDLQPSWTGPAATAVANRVSVISAGIWRTGSGPAVIRVAPQRLGSVPAPAARRRHASSLVANTCSRLCRPVIRSSFATSGCGPMRP